jgi:hypothetical protein
LQIPKRLQNLGRRKLSTGRVSKPDLSESSRAETETELAPVSVTTLPTLPERSLYSRLEQQPEESLPPRKSSIF